MSDNEIRFDSRKAEEFFASIGKNVKDIEEGHRAYVNAVGALVFQDIMDHFDKERGPTKKWPGWSKVYAQRMARVGKGGNKILQDNGHLRQSFKPTNWRKKSKGLEWYNNARTAKGFPYAYAHNEGSEGGSPLPKREFMWLSKAAAERIAQLTAVWMLSGSDKKVVS